MCRSSVAQHWLFKPEALCLFLDSTTFLSFSLPFQRPSDSDSSDYFSLDDLYRALNLRGAPSTGFPVLCYCSDSFEFTPPSLFFSDLNECINNATSPCHQYCANTVGSYQCSCKFGYTLTTDGRTCSEALMHTYILEWVCRSEILSGRATAGVCNYLHPGWFDQ